MVSLGNFSESVFFVTCSGEIDSCQIQGGDNLYVKYSYNFGVDWSFVHGMEDGVSQIAKKDVDNGFQLITWNFPLDSSFKSTNVHGWPQLVLSVWGINLQGQDVIRGYGCVHLPTTSGRHERYIYLYKPVSSSWYQRFQAWITGITPEFFDSKFVAQGKGREVTRVESNGVVKIVFNITTKNMNDFGYQASEERKQFEEKKL